MKINKTIRMISVLTIVLFALGLFTVSVHANAFPKSNKVAMVPDQNSYNGGGLYVGSSWPLGDSFTFTNLAPGTIADGTVPDPIVAGGYDTVVLMACSFDFATYWGYATFSSRITSFVNGGGKLIIYTSETPSATAFANFIYPFTVDTPGQTGSSGGTLTNLADDTLSSSNPADASYINLALLTSQTDAVGDLTVMTSYNANWYIDMFGINVNGVGGPAHTYAFYGSGLIIFNGLDLDYDSNYAPSNANGGAAISMVWWRELTGPSTIGPGQSVNGLTLTPATATNLVGTTHTVTATVRDTKTNNPVSGVVVTFTITSGPNAGLTGQATTDANGEATFSWSSTVPGTDTVEASIPNAAGGTITSTATKDWTSVNPVVPEAPFGTMALVFAFMAGLGLFAFKSRIPKGFKIFSK